MKKTKNMSWRLYYINNMQYKINKQGDCINATVKIRKGGMIAIMGGYLTMIRS